MLSPSASHNASHQATNSDATALSRLQRHAARTSTAVIAGVVVAAVVIFTFWLGMSPIRGLIHDDEDTFCCPDVIWHLWKASNISISPCRDFYGYTCYNWDRSEKETAFSKMMLDKVTTPTFTGSTTSRAGAVIAQYYRSCLTAFSGKDFGLDRAVVALLGALRPRLHPTPREMLDLVFHISLGYGMSSGLVITLRSSMYLSLSVESGLGWNTDQGHHQRALKIFNDFTGANVSWEEVKTADTTLFLQSTCDCCLNSRTPVLTSIFPTTSLQEWKIALQAYGVGELPNVVRHCNVSILRKYSDVVITGVQPTALALLVVEASVRFWNSLHERYTIQAYMNVLCQPRAEDLGLLWDIVVMDTFGDPVKDGFVRWAYEAVGVHVIHYAASIFPTDDANIIRRIISDYKVILSTDLHLLDIGLPLPASDYWRDTLSLKDYELSVRRHQAELGIPQYQYGSFRNNIAIQLGYTGILILPLIYPKINEQFSEKVVNMPLIGLEVAENMWYLIFSRQQSLSERSQDIITNFFICLSEKDTLAMSRLSLQILVNASRTSNWKEAAGSWGVKKISRHQLFYINYVYLHLCGKRMPNVPTANYVQGVVSSTPDFSSAFNCPLQSNVSVHCSFEASRFNKI